MNLFFPPHQEVVFVAMLASGILLGFVYDFFVVKRKVLFCGFAVTFFDDILFSALAFLLSFTAVYSFNNGIFRWFELFAVFLGFVFYKLTLSIVVQKTLFFILNGFVSLLKYILHLFAFPFLKIYMRIDCLIKKIYTKHLLKYLVLYKIYKSYKKYFIPAGK